MATLKTMSWNEVDGERSFREVIIPIPKILAVHPCEEDGGETCYVQMDTKGSIWIDVPVKRMREILNDYHTGRNREPINTHPDLIDMGVVPKAKSDGGKDKKHGKK